MNARPVWLTKAQRDALRGGPSAWFPVQEITAAWDAAPADPHETAALCVSQWNGYGPDVQAHHRKCVDAVFEALGMPR